MTHHSTLPHRIVLILVCLCINQTLSYSQTSSREVVKFRFAVDLRDVQGSEFNPIDKLLAAKQKDGTVRIIDLTDGRERAMLLLPNKKPVAMHWSPDGQRLLINNERFTLVWDRVEDKLTSPDGLQQKDYLRAEYAQWSPSGTTILTSKTDDSIKADLLDKKKTIIRLWCARSGQLKSEVKIKGTFGRAQFSPNGKLLLTSGWHDDAKLWDVETGRLLATLTPPQRALWNGGSSAEFSPDGKSIVVHSYERGIYLWDSVSGLLKTTVALEEFGEDGYSLLEFSPDGKVFAIYREHLKGFSTITSIELRDGETGELRSVLTGKNMLNAADQVAWTSDGQTLITGGGSKKYESKIWDIATGKLRATFPLVLTYSRIPFDFGYKNRDQLSVHPTQPIGFTVNEKFVGLWSLETGERLQTIENTRGARWSADGTLLVTFPNNLDVAQVWEPVSSLTVHATAAAQRAAQDR